jgi:hypothetical protein
VEEGTLATDVEERTATTTEATTSIMTHLKSGAFFGYNTLFSLVLNMLLDA